MNNPVSRARATIAVRSARPLRRALLVAVGVLMALAGGQAITARTASQIRDNCGMTGRDIELPTGYEPFLHSLTSRV